MDQEHAIAFGPFRLETTQGRLWQGDHWIPLRPRSLAMLGYLVAHPGRLVTKAEVQQHVGGDACHRSMALCSRSTAGTRR
jgi:DNA-binding winged helix-turn-helix (wHTH) protein